MPGRSLGGLARIAAKITQAISLKRLASFRKSGESVRLRDAGLPNVEKAEQPVADWQQRRKLTTARCETPSWDVHLSAKESKTMAGERKNRGIPVRRNVRFD